MTTKQATAIRWGVGLLSVPLVLAPFIPIDATIAIAVVIIGITIQVVTGRPKPPLPPSQPHTGPDRDSFIDRV